MVPHFGDGVFCLVKLRLLGDCTMVRKKGESLGTVGGECFLWNHWHTFIMPFSLIVIAMKGQMVQYGCL